MIEKTLQQIRKKMSESGLDSLIIGNSPNIRYLTGFRGDYGFVVISPSRALFFTNPLYIEDARSSVSASYEILEVKKNIFKSFKNLDGLLWGKKAGYEAEKTTCGSFKRLRKILTDTKLAATSNFVEEFREVKEAHEIDAVRRAQAIAERVFSSVLTQIGEGVEECELAMEIDYQFRKLGGEGSAFKTIVASGPLTSRPHAVSSRRKLRPGDLVLFDMGTVIDGYASDMTRTVVLGKASNEQKKVYNAVLDAQTAVLSGIKSGLKCSHVDRIARDVIGKAGYKKRFVHSLGHGVGLEVHENPFLSKRSKSFLKKNSVVTIEPGIYIPDWGGIRIEDMVVVNENGCENLTGAPKDLLEL